MYEGMVLYGGEQVAVARRTSGWKNFAVRMLKAAVVVGVAFGAAMWSKVSVMDNLSEKTEILRVPAGDKMDMILADGTHIWMNSGTEVEIPVVFSRKYRSIKLNEGEVLLDVAKDEKKPFLVDTWAGEIAVLGTKFEVTANESEEDFSASLLRGSVRVTNKMNPDEVYVLSPNSRVSFENGSLKLEQIKDASVVGCWSTGMIDVSSLPFDELMKRFERAYDVNILIEKKELPVITYTRGKVHISDGIEHALSVLQLVSDFTYVYDRETNTIVIR